METIKEIKGPAHHKITINNLRVVCLFIFITVFSVATLRAEIWEVSFYGKDGKRLCSFSAETAITPEEQEMGLMFRKSLNRNGGMLFVFKDDGYRYFWMKNTYIPLDFVFINSKMEVANIHRHARPFDEAGIPSGTPVKYVLEINEGTADGCSIKAGTRVRLNNKSK